MCLTHGDVIEGPEFQLGEPASCDLHDIQERSRAQIRDRSRARILAPQCLQALLMHHKYTKDEFLLYMLINIYLTLTPATTTWFILKIFVHLVETIYFYSHKSITNYCILWFLFVMDPHVFLLLKNDISTHHSVLHPQIPLKANTFTFHAKISVQRTLHRDRWEATCV